MMPTELNSEVSTLMEELEYMLNGISSFSNTVQSIIAVLMTVAWWLIFQKAFEPGWKILIPFYNTYIKYKIINKPKYSIPVIIIQVLTPLIVIAFFITMFFNFFNIASGKDGEPGYMVNSLIIMGLGLLLLATSITQFVFKIILCEKLSKAFGMSTGFTIGLFFIPFVFIPILGFNKKITYVVNNKGETKSENDRITDSTLD